MANRVQIILEMLNKSDSAMADLQRDVARINSGVDQMASRTAAGMRVVESSTRNASQGFLGLGSGITAVAGKMLILEQAATRAAALVDKLFIDFNSTIETANMGIASSLLSSGEFIDKTTGKALKGQAAVNAAISKAKSITEELQAANFATLGTLDQLVRAYQEALPVALAKGFDPDQVKDFSVALVQAAGAIGLPLDQLGEESRSLLNGTINPRTSRIATALGLRNEDIAQFKGNADGLFNFLMDKLSAYRLFGIESQKTWAGVWSNSLDIFKQFTAKIGEPVFEGLKRDLKELADKIVTVDEETGTISWNPQFLAEVDRLKETVDDIYGGISGITKLIAGIGGPAMEEWLRVLRPIVKLLEKAGDTADSESSNGIKSQIGRRIGRGMLGPLGDLLGGISEAQEREESRKRAAERLREKETGAGESKKNNDEEYQHNQPAKDEKEAEKALAKARARRDALERFELELTAHQGEEIDRRLAAVDRWVMSERKLLEKAGLSKQAIEEKMTAVVEVAEAEKAKIRDEYAQKQAQNMERFEREMTDLQGSELDKRLAQVDKWLSDQTKLLEDAGLDAAAIEQKTVEATRAAEEEKAKIRREAAAAARENAIEAALAQIDLAERQRTIGREDAARQRLDLQRELLDLQQKHLDQMDKLADPDGWYSQLDAINATREALVDLEDELQRLTGPMADGARRGLADWLDEVDTSFEIGQKAATDAATGMQGAFESLLFDAQRGQLQSLGDYWDMFLSTIQSSFAQILSQQAVAWILESLGLAKQQNNAQDATSLGTTAALTGLLAAQTGVVSGLSAAYWALAAAKTAAGAGGGGGGGGGGAAVPTVTAHTGGLILHDGGPVRVVPRFHVGGLAADEVPAILQTGERVLSREQNRIFDRLAASLDGGSALPPVQVTIVTQDAQSFKAPRSQMQTQATIARSIDRARRRNT